MIILNKNYIDSTASLTTSAGTSTAVNIYDRNKLTQYISENTTSTAITMRYALAATQTVDKIILLNHNLKNFNIYPNTTTANFSPAIATTTNAATDLYFSFATLTTIKEIIITVNSTTVSGDEKKIGELIISKLIYNFANDRFPTSENYKPRIMRKQIIHEMADGGVKIYNVANKFAAEIGLSFVPTTTEITLKSIYTTADPIIFIPFETTTSWNGDIAECVWVGDYSFMEFSDNNRGIGYRGTISLRQTSGGSF